MDYYAVICLVPMFIFALAASQGYDGFGFWTTFLWTISALSATIGIYVYRGQDVDALGFIGMFYLILPICILANYRSHVTLSRLFADIYTVTAAPIHSAGWMLNVFLRVSTKGSIPLKIPSPWPIINHKPQQSKSWETIQDKRIRRWRKLTRKLNVSQKGANED